MPFPGLHLPLGPEEDASDYVHCETLETQLRLILEKADGCAIECEFRETLENDLKLDVEHIDDDISQVVCPPKIV